MPVVSEVFVKRAAAVGCWNKLRKDAGRHCELASRCSSVGGVWQHWRGWEMLGSVCWTELWSAVFGATRGMKGDGCREKRTDLLLKKRCAPEPVQRSHELLVSADVADRGRWRSGGSGCAVRGVDCQERSSVWIGCLAARLVLRPGDCLCRNDEGLLQLPALEALWAGGVFFRWFAKTFYQLSLPSASGIPCFVTRW